MTDNAHRCTTRKRQLDVRALGAAAGLLVCALTPAPATAQQSTPRITLNEHMVQEVTRPSGFDVNDKKAVFALVFNSLPDRVKVYPTENYYYFRFIHAGQNYSGNIRLENELRDQGKVHFAYGVDYVDWLPPGEITHVLFDPSSGIATEKVDALTYRLTFGGKSVVFELNDMAQVKPPAGLLGADERYIGPVFDESAVRFFLVYDSKLKQFLYLLDETVPPTDVLVHSPQNDRILVGKRTGFGYYRDQKIERKILIGVFEGNVQVNNYFDGPFDQLPDNFLEGDILKDAILQIEPQMAGQIDRFGSSADGENRYMIAPYLQYRQLDELDMFHRCATNKALRPELYHACFVVENAESQKPTLAADRLQRERAPAKPRQERRRR